MKKKGGEALSSLRCLLVNLVLTVVIITAFYGFDSAKKQNMLTCNIYLLVSLLSIRHPNMVDVACAPLS